MRAVSISASRPYEVRIGSGLLSDLGAQLRGLFAAPRSVMVVSDDTVSTLYGPAAERSLRDAGFCPERFVFPHGERSKTLSTYAALQQALLTAGFTRSDLIVALGGGVTGDIAGFAGASYMRGCAVAQIPTSLLAMVDSSVGGKTAIDLAAGKNLAGAFWQPRVVIADPRCLSTIGHDLFTDSCGEVIKHGVLADPNLFESLETKPLNAPGYDETMLADIIARNVEIKRNVVDADERERGLRQTLNLGHTIGHAVEAASDFTLGHGTCVALGLCAIARAAAAMGELAKQDSERIERVVAAHGLPTDTDLDHETVVRLAHSDKKRHGDGVNVVLPRAIGSVEVRRMSMGEFAELVDAGCGTATCGTTAHLA